MKLDRSLFRRLGQLELSPPGRVTGRRQGERASKSVGSGVAFADHRPYHPGDDLRRVDWNAWQRLQTVLLRLFQEDRNQRISIFVDATGSMSTGQPSKLDHAGNLAAGLTVMGLLSRDSVRLACYGGTPHDRVATGHDMGALAGLLDLLEHCEPGTTCDSPRAKILALAGTRPADRAILLTDALAQEDELEATLRSLATVGRHPLLLQVLSPEDLDPDLSKPQRMVDAETGQSVEVPGGPAIQAAWNAARDAWLADLDARCRRLGITRLVASTSVSTTHLLTDTLRRRGIVGTGGRG